MTTLRHDWRRSEAASLILKAAIRVSAALASQGSDDADVARSMIWNLKGGPTSATNEMAAMRAHLSEFGIVAPVGRLGLERLLTVISDREDARVTLPSGEFVEADERYFLVQVGEHAVSDANWTQLEHEEISAHRWWTQAELRMTSEQVWPERLEATLVDAAVWEEAL